MKWKKFDEEKPVEGALILVRPIFTPPEYSIIYFGNSKKHVSCDHDGCEIIKYFFTENLSIYLDGFKYTDKINALVAEFWMCDRMQWMYVKELFENQVES